MRTDNPVRIANLAPVLQVRDLVAALAYYRDALGFTVDFTWREPPTYAGLTLGDVCLHLSKNEAGAPAVVAAWWRP